MCLRDGDKKYILHPRGLKVGDFVISDFDIPIKKRERKKGMIIKKISIVNFHNR